jgi:STE24 endopeptidase
MRSLIVARLGMLLAICLGPLAMPSPAADPCRERALFAGSTTAVPAGADSASAPVLLPERLYDVQLQPQANVSFVTAPGKSIPADGVYAGIAALQISTPGVYRIAADTSFWIDVVEDGGLASAKGFQGAAGCNAPHKIVEFDFPVARQVMLQFSGAASASVRVSITRAGFDADAATAAYLAMLSPQARARSDAYFEGGYWLLLWDCVVTVLVAWLLLATRLSLRMRDWAQRLTRVRALQSAMYAIQYIVLTTILMLPWAAYEGYFREHQYGMSNQNLGSWLGDQLKILLLVAIFGTVAVVAVYAVIRRARQTWWLWGAAVMVALLIFGATVSPSYLEPVFNKFYPLADSPLKQQILSLARANGIAAKQVYEFDASRQTTKISAHVSGMFGSVQISLNDNLMRRASPEEIKAVLGHEMGHYVMNHVYQDIVYSGLIIVIGFAFLAWAWGAVQTRFGARWGLRDISDEAGLPLLVALFTVFSFVLTPVQNSITRSMEAQADAFGLDAAREPDGFAQAAVQLSEYRKMQPGPVEEFIFFDHPSGWNRIHRAMVWKAENINTPDIQAYDASH